MQDPCLVRLQVHVAAQVVRQQRPYLFGIHNAYTYALVIVLSCR
jgi:hypothetical protein